MENTSLKYTCLFGGGAIRGAAYVGAIKALDELGIHPQNIAGSSVGAVVASLLAIGYDAKEIREIFLDVNFELFKDIQFGFGPKFALSKGKLFLNWIRELIEKKYYGSKYKKGKNKSVTFKDIKKNLIIITTNLSDFTCQEFSKFETPDFEIATAVRISCSMPGLMNPYEYNNNLLVDGDLQKSLPMWKLSNHLLNDDERILEFRLEGDYDGSDKNAIDYANTIYSCITSICTSFISNTYGNRDKFYYITLNTGAVLIVDFNCSKAVREELFHSGYEQTMEYFKKTLPPKKNELLAKYIFINKSMKNAYKLIQHEKYTKAKQVLSEMFVDLCDYKETIDIAIYKDIRNFYHLYTNNIKYPSLFGKIKLKNKEIIIPVLEKIINDIENNIKNMKKYIKTYSI